MQNTWFNSRIKLFALYCDFSKGAPDPYLLVYNLNSEFPEAVLQLDKSGIEQGPGCIAFSQFNLQPNEYLQPDNYNVLSGTRENIHLFSVAVDEKNNYRTIIQKHEKLKLPTKADYWLQSIGVIGPPNSRRILAGRRRSYGSTALERKLGWSELYVFDSKTARFEVYEKVNLFGNENISNRERGSRPLAIACIDDAIYLNSNNGIDVRLQKERTCKKAVQLPQNTTDICIHDSEHAKMLFAATGSSSIYCYDLNRAGNTTGNRAGNSAGKKDSRDHNSNAGSHGSNAESHSLHAIPIQAIPIYPALNANYSMMSIGKEGNTNYLIAGANAGGIECHIAAFSMHDKDDQFALKGFSESTHSAMKSITTFEFKGSEPPDSLGVFAASENGSIVFWLLNNPDNPMRVFRKPEFSREGHYSCNSIAVGRIDRGLRGVEGGLK